jgi:hypothetical protein
MAAGSCLPTLASSSASGSRSFNVRDSEACLGCAALPALLRWQAAHPASPKHSRCLRRSTAFSRAVTPCVVLLCIVVEVARPRGFRRQAIRSANQYDPRINIRRLPDASNTRGGREPPRSRPASSQARRAKAIFSLSCLRKSRVRRAIRRVVGTDRPDIVRCARCTCSVRARIARPRLQWGQRAQWPGTQCQFGPCSTQWPGIQR